MVDYFATSLPTMLLFEDDLQRRQEVTAKFLQAQALHGLGRSEEAAKLFEAAFVDRSELRVTFELMSF
jgi:hypothetical protein